MMCKKTKQYFTVLFSQQLTLSHWRYSVLQKPDLKGRTGPFVVQSLKWNPAPLNVNIYLCMGAPKRPNVLGYISAALFCNSVDMPKNKSSEGLRGNFKSSHIFEPDLEKFIQCFLGFFFPSSTDMAG